MGDLVQAASSGSLSSFALALAGVLVAALIAVVTWLVRERIEARKRYDQTLEKRLQAGSQRMEGMEKDLRALQVQVVEMSSRLVNHDQCSAYRGELRGSLERVSEVSVDVRTSIGRLEGRVEEGFRQVSRLLQGLVQVPRGGGDGGDG